MKKYFLLFTLSLFFISQGVYADTVSQFVFVTKPQTILAGVLSKEITIQSQNTKGFSVQVPETYNIAFTSSSPTGKFVSSSGKPASKTMSKNTANKTIYYTDSSEGDFILIISASSRTGKEKFTVAHIS